MENILNANLGLHMVLLYYACCYLLSAVMSFFVIKDLESTDDDAKIKIDKDEYIKLFKTPGLWLVSILVFGAYCVFALQSYTTPYMSEVAKISSVTVG